MKAQASAARPFCISSTSAPKSAAALAKFLGDETGRGDGLGANLNLPLEPGSGDALWLAAVERAAGAAAGFGATALVIALGVDAAIDDPESPLQVSMQGYHRAGEVLGALGLPTVVVQEGGYHLPTLGQLVGATLDGLG